MGMDDGNTEGLAMEKEVGRLSAEIEARRVELDSMLPLQDPFRAIDLRLEIVALRADLDRAKRAATR